MKQIGRVKKVFAAGNTGIGFHSFFQYIAGPDIQHVYVIKGGPGTGKSTLMRQVAEAVVGRGFAVEFHHCASDIGSLDGLVVPALKVAFIDGMHPHVYDPQYPGALDQILNLGEYWDSSGIRAHQQEIMAISGEGSRLFQSAYRYLGAARQIHGNWAEKIGMMQDWGWVNQQSYQLLNAIMGARPIATQPGRDRHLFASAFTPQGPKSYPETLTGPATEVIVIKGPPGSGKSTLVDALITLLVSPRKAAYNKAADSSARERSVTSTLLHKIAAAALERGYLTELYHSPMEPAQLQHVLLPEPDVFIATSTELFPYAPTVASQTISLDYGLNQD